MRSNQVHVDNLDDQVDIALHKIALSPNLTLSISKLYDVEIMDENAYLVDHFMLEKGLIKIVKEGRTITGKGLEISNFGGWTPYQRQFKKRSYKSFSPSEANLNNQLELKSLRSEIEQMKRELMSKAEKESNSALIIKSLLEQKTHNQLILVLTGVAIGFITSCIVWFSIFH